MSHCEASLAGRNTGKSFVRSSLNLRARRILVVAAASFILTYAVHGWPAVWDGRGGVTLEFGLVSNSVNVGAESGAATILSIQPFYSFARETRDHTLSGRLGVSHQQFSSGGGQSTTPSAFLNSRVTLIDRSLWFSSTANASSQRISNGDFLDDALTSEDDVNTTVQLQLGPQLHYQNSDNLQFRARTGVARSQTSRNGSQNSRDNTSIGMEASLLLAVDRHGRLVSINSRVQESRFDDGGEEARVASLSVAGVTPISPRTAIYARLGHDWIQIEQPADVTLVDGEADVTETKISGEQYSLGFRWRPSRRVEFNAEYSERAFGSQPSLSLLLIGRHTQLEFQWSRDLQLTKLVDTGLEGTSGTSGIEGVSVEPDATEEGSLTLGTCDFLQGSNCSTAFIADSQTIDETISATYTLRGKASTLSFSLTRTIRGNITDTANRERNSLGLNLSRTLARNLSASISGQVSESQSSVESALMSGSQSIRASVTWLAR